MDRTLATQLIAMLIVLSALLRWVPDTDPRDALGLGDPLVALRIDRELLGFDDMDLRRAYLRSVKERDPEYFHFWKGKLLEVRDVLAARTPQTVVQLKGFGRNLMWPVIYDLYPVPVVGNSYEEGSRVDDPDVPGAAIMKSGIIPYEEMSDDQLRALRERRRGR